MAMLLTLVTVERERIEAALAFGADLEPSGLAALATLAALAALALALAVLDGSTGFTGMAAGGGLSGRSLRLAQCSVRRTAPTDPEPSSFSRTSGRCMSDLQICDSTDKETL